MCNFCCSFFFLIFSAAAEGIILLRSSKAKYSRLTPNNKEIDAILLSHEFCWTNQKCLNTGKYNCFFVWFFRTLRDFPFWIHCWIMNFPNSCYSKIDCASLGQILPFHFEYTAEQWTFPILAIAKLIVLALARSYHSILNTLLNNELSQFLLWQNWLC